MQFGAKYIVDLSCRALAVMCAAWVFNACTDDTFDPSVGKYSEFVSFRTEAPGGWTDGDGARSAGALHEVNIEKIGGEECGAPLYLITEVTEASDSVVEVTGSRGSDFTAATIPSIGMSAICYSEWPDDSTGMSPNFAHNIRLYKDGSRSSWAPSDDEKLLWTGSGNIKFYAYAPYSDDFGTGDGKYPGSAVHSTTGLPAIDFTVTDNVAEQVDLLEATAVCGGDHYNDVALKFSHALTAVTIKTGSDMLAGKITEVTLSGVYGRGTHVIGSPEWDFSETVKSGFTIKPKDDDADIPAQGSDNIYSKPGTEIVGGELTLFMIPQTLPDGAKLTVKFKPALSDKLVSENEYTLTADLKGGKWLPNTKVVYSISSTGIVITPKIDADPLPAILHPNGYVNDWKMALYGELVQVGHKSPEKIKLPIKRVEYSTDGGLSWAAGEWHNGDDSKAGLSDKVARSFKLDAQSSFTHMRKFFTEKGLDINSEAGTDVVNLAAKEPANCYVINKPGYYSFPLEYGNARTGANAYTYMGAPIADDNPSKPFVLANFVGYDNISIAGPVITGVSDVVLVWQDAPGLISDIKLEGSTVKFHAGWQTFTQGNAVIAARNSDGVILWSWHIWATHYKWDGSEDIEITTAEIKDTDGTVLPGATYKMAPCNLGFCEPHKGDKKREFKVRLIVELPLPDKSKAEKAVSVTGTMTQEEIVASLAGDNTYYQWGRKDPMLPGVWNSDTRENGYKGYGNYDTQFNMDNKKYYSDDFTFERAPSTVSIGETIKHPYRFYMHNNYGGDKSPDDFLRRHWHDGSTGTEYKNKGIMNYWNANLSEMSKEDAGIINNKEVQKTIYDPCPPGYNVPSSHAFSTFSDIYGPGGMYFDDFNTKEGYYPDIYDSEGNRIGWKFKNGGNEVFFPATGLRDMGSSKNLGNDWGEADTWPAHADLTFIATASFKEATGATSYRCLIFYLDRRPEPINASSGKDDYNKICVNCGSNNSYGFSVRPVHSAP